MIVKEINNNLTLATKCIYREPGANNAQEVTLIAYKGPSRRGLAQMGNGPPLAIPLARVRASESKEFDVEKTTLRQIGNDGKFANVIAWLEGLRLDIALPQQLTPKDQPLSLKGHCYAKILATDDHDPVTGQVTYMLYINDQSPLGARFSRLSLAITKFIRQLQEVKSHSFVESAVRT